MGNNTAGYMLTGGFILGYATSKLGLQAGDLLNIITIGWLVWLISTWIGGVVSDRVGRKKMFIIGWVFLLVWLFPLFLLIETRNLAWVTVSLVVFGAFMGFSYGPLPALYAELFPARIRFERFLDQLRTGLGGWRRFRPDYCRSVGGQVRYHGGGLHVPVHLGGDFADRDADFERSHRCEFISE